MANPANWWWTMGCLWAVATVCESRQLQQTEVTKRASDVASSYETSISNFFSGTATGLVVAQKWTEMDFPFPPSPPPFPCYIPEECDTEDTTPSSPPSPPTASPPPPGVLVAPVPPSVLPHPPPPALELRPPPPPSPHVAPVPIDPFPFPDGDWNPGDMIRAVFGTLIAVVATPVMDVMRAIGSFIHNLLHG
eukprot:jgi/Botrbrau1/7753/Bobra.0159s0182.1